MNKFSLFSGICAITIALILPGCDIETQSIVNPTEFSFTYDIENDEEAEEWEVGFADYPPEEEEDYALSFRYDTLPENLPQQGALRISGTDQNNDLFMFLSKQVNGLKPNTTYNIIFNIEFASQYPESAGGTNPSQGASVGMLVGAMQQQPEVDETDDGVITTNFDHDIPNERGAMTGEVLNIGNIGIPGDVSVYTLISRSNEDIPFVETTDKDGSLWVIVGTDSEFNGTTTLFFDQIGISFREK